MMLAACLHACLLVAATQEEQASAPPSEAALTADRAGAPRVEADLAIVPTRRWEIDGSIAVASDYVGRGVSNSAREPTLQGSVVLKHRSGVFLDGFVSNSALATADVELGLALGYAETVGKVSYSALAVYTAYPGVDRRIGLNFWEGFFTVTAPVGRGTPRLTLKVSPDFIANSKLGIGLEGGAAVKLPLKLGLDVLVGRQWAADNVALGVPDRNYWRLQVSRPIADVTLFAAYWDTDIDSRNDCAAGANICAASLVVGARKTF